MSKAGPIPEELTQKFNDLGLRFEIGATCLLSVTRKEDDSPAYLICVVSQSTGDGPIDLIPVAEMIEGNPFEKYNQPEGSTESYPDGE